MTGQVLSSGNVTDAFVISNGVKQGCVLAPVLFNVFFTSMLSHADLDLKKEVYIRYRLDGSLFDLRRLTAKTRSLQTLLQGVFFADDCALVAHTEQDLQRMLDLFFEASKLFGLTISLGKTGVLYQPAPYSHHLPHHHHWRQTTCQRRTFQIYGEHHILWWLLGQRNWY